MNYDRFLTRVFDKQEKRMLYAGTSLPDTKINNKRKYEFIGTDGDGILFFSSDGCLMRYKNKYYSKDRFIPMQCQGTKDKKKKLFYEADIVIDGECKAIVTCDEYSNVLFLDPFNKEDYGHFYESIFEDCTILGNKWENPKLLEESRC